MIPTNPVLQAVAVAVLVLGAGRLTRVITWDDYPPSAWLRAKWVDLTHGNGWSKLFLCFWCMSPWISLLALIHGLLSFGRPWEWTWWLFWGWLALSYLTAMVIARDEPPTHD